MSQLKSLRNFTIRETNNKINRQFKLELLRYKHLENMLNILIAYEFNTTKNNNMMKLLQNSIYMKAILSGNSGGEKTKHNIKIINDYFNHSHHHYKLFQQAIEFSIKYLNDKNISMLITRLRKDWANFFTFLKDFKKGKLSHPPSYPKPKKLKQVFNYSIPLEPGKWSSSTPYKKGHLGLNLGKSMIYTKYFNEVNKDKNNHITCPDYLQGKHINSISISLSHGQVYYQIQYDTKQSKPKRYHQINDIKPLPMPIKSAGLDIGLLNLLSVYTNDDSTKSLIISGKELISKNNSFNKGLAKLQTTLANLKLAGKIRSKEYVQAKRKRSALFEKRKRYLDNYTNQISAGLVKYVIANKITRIALSKNLSFSKSKG